jgi:Ca-activated chloride channel family protein
MKFLWPHSLWLFLLVPAIAAVFHRMRKRTLASYPGLAGGRPGRARHVPAALFALAMVLLLAAAARPTAPLVMPTETRTVILAIDVSGSMAADDVWPTRLVAAQAAARTFLRTLPASVRVGIIAFSDEAHLVQAPTAERDNVLFALDSLRIENGTAIGRGLLASLEAAPKDVPAAIILLTDGQNTHGPAPMEIAPLAERRGVRVYTVAVGTTFGMVRDERGFSAMVGVDEEPLREMAALTGAEHFQASSAPDLSRIYAALGSKVVLARGPTEISALLCAAAALIATVSAAVSLLWFGRLL